MTRQHSPARAAAGLVVLLAALAPDPARAQNAFTIGGLTVSPGSVASGSLLVERRPGDEGTTVPFTVVHGAGPGSVLALVAGVHGQECAPILTLQRLRTAIDPRSLSGTIIMVHIANVPSFLSRTIYYSPVDGKNLNRVFPGRPDGTLSERIADTITREVIDRATHVVDLHCGDGNESLRPYVYWTVTGEDAVVEAGRRMALATGLDHIVIDRERPTDPAASVYLANTAVLRGKPALTVESGFLATIDEPSISRLEAAVAGLLRELRMRTDGPRPVEQPVWIDTSVVVRATASGIFFPAVAGHGVSTLDGEVLYVIATPPMSAGEPVAFIGQRRP